VESATAAPAFSETASSNATSTIADSDSPIAEFVSATEKPLKMYQTNYMFRIKDRISEATSIMALVKI